MTWQEKGLAVCLAVACVASLVAVFSSLMIMLGVPFP